MRVAVGNDAPAMLGLAGELQIGEAPRITCASMRASVAPRQW
ncbi:MAG: hypothetical protein ACR2NR_21445 [Solirubrobacteraceae bacterium]